MGGEFLAGDHVLRHQGGDKLHERHMAGIDHVFLLHDLERQHVGGGSDTALSVVTLQNLHLSTAIGKSDKQPAICGTITRWRRHHDVSKQTIADLENSVANPM